MKLDGAPSGLLPPLYPILCAYLLGVVAASCISLSQPVLLITVLVLFPCALFSTFCLRKAATASVLWVASFFWLGILALTYQLHPIFPAHHVIHFAEREKVVVEGLLIRPPEVTTQNTRLYVEARSLVKENTHMACTGRILLSVPNLTEPFEYGDRIRFAGTLGYPSNFNNPGGFDYRQYLASRGIWVTSFIKDPMKIARLATGQGNPLWTWIEGVRSRIRTFLDQYATPSSGPILKALVLGEQGTIPQNVREDFTTSGVAHIIAISGFNLGIIAFTLFHGFIWAFKRSERIILGTDIFKLASVMTIPPIVFYTLIAGAQIPTVRATIMIMVYFLSVLLDRPRDLYHTLALAALVITLVDPASLLEGSFQLSFMAVFSIVYLVPVFSGIFRKDEILPEERKGPLAWLASQGKGLLFMTLAAMAGTAPIIVYHFHRLSPIGLVSNFVIGPLLSFLAIPAALIASFLSLCSPHFAMPFVWIADCVVEISVLLNHCLASLPGASFYMVTPTLLEIILFYGLIFVLLNLRRSLLYKVALAVILLIAVADGGYWLMRTHFNRTLRITSIDVGQGDSILVEFPKGKRALIDGGGLYNDRFDVGKQVIAPFLWKKKINKIDFLILTHPHPDHLNGLIFIARYFNVDELWDSGQKGDSPEFLELMAMVKDQGIQRISLFRGDAPRVINGVLVQPLHPPREGEQKDPAPGSDSGTNNRSLVLKLTFGSQTILLAGDVEKEGEAEIIRSGVDLASRIIKVPHHGSLSSSTPQFVAKVRPEIAIINVRERNSFLPSEEVLQRYKDLGCTILRTDLHGAISMETDEKALRIQTFLKPYEFLNAPAIKRPVVY